MKHTDEELAGLTEEERAGLLEGEDGDDQGTQPETDEAKPDDAGTTTDTDDDAKPDDGEESPTRETEPNAETGGTGTEDEPQRDDGKDAYNGPYLNATAPDDAQAKLDDITARKDELIAKFDEGDIDVREYQRQLDGLYREERAIEQDQFKAQISTEMRQSAWVNQHVKGFLKDHKEYSENQALFGALDLEVRKLQAKADDPFDPAILEDAHKNLRDNALALLGVVDEKPATERAPAAAKQERVVPPTLGKLPAAQIEDTTNGRYAVLDRLADTDPLKYQDELAKMTEAELDAYQRSME